MTDFSHLLSNVRSIAIVGAKDVPSQPVDRVGQYLLAVGYKVFPVHPVRKEVWGIKAFRSLTEISEQVDLVNVFRNSHFCLAHAQECLRLKIAPQVFWMQLGISNPTVRSYLEPKGIVVVEDACIMIEHENLTANGVM